MESDRHRLGQWFTPPPVCDLTLSLVLEHGTQRVLDPSCGDGAFLSRAAARLPKSAAVVGMDVSPEVAAMARLAVPSAQVLCRDFFAAECNEPFDAIVGNPPYVRTERLDKEHKVRIDRVLGGTFPGSRPTFFGRGDLAVAFIWRALAWVRPGGRVGFVVSSALLDAAYASTMWQELLPHGRLRLLVEAPDERWFPEAAVNAVICVVERAPADGKTAVQVARLEVSAAEAAGRVQSAAALSQVAELREADARRPRSWAAAARSPKAWFDFARRSGSSLSPLGEVANVARGMTSGSNDVFYLSRAQASGLGLEEEVLKPLYRSPREQDAGRVLLDPDKSPNVALVVPKQALGKYPRAAAYLKDHSAVATRPTLRGRVPWWALPPQRARLFLTKSYGARFVQRFASTDILCDQRVYWIQPAGDDLLLWAAILNSTFTAFALESLGRASLGHGALEWTVADAKMLPVLAAARIGKRQRTAALSALSDLTQRPIGPVWEERHARDRQRLDAALLPDVDKSTMLDLHDSLCASVRRRMARARSAVGVAAPPARRRPSRGGHTERF